MNLLRIDRELTVNALRPARPQKFSCNLTTAIAISKCIQMIMVAASTPNKAEATDSGSEE